MQYVYASDNELKVMCWGKKLQIHEIYWKILENLIFVKIDILIMMFFHSARWHSNKKHFWRSGINKWGKKIRMMLEYIRISRITNSLIETKPLDFCPFGFCIWGPILVCDRCPPEEIRPRRPSGQTGTQRKWL